MITIVSGGLGGGKTLYGLQWLGNQALSGRPCYTNIKLSDSCPFHNRVAFLDDDGDYPVFRGDGKREPVRAFWQFCKPGGAYVIDEADNYWDSMDFARLHEASEHARLYFKQSRKFGDDLVLIVQDIENLWGRIRRVTSMYIHCENTARSGSYFMRLLPRGLSQFLRVCHTGWPFTDNNFFLSGGMSYREASPMFTWYETSQLISGAKGIKVA